jgi:hypothetical protein
MRSVLVVCAAAAAAAHSLVFQGYWSSRQVHPSLLQVLLGCRKFLCPQRMFGVQCVTDWPLVAFAKIDQCVPSHPFEKLAATKDDTHDMLGTYCLKSSSLSSIGHQSPHQLLCPSG